MNLSSQQARPLVSVIIPTYNRPDYLKLAIASVVCQTYSNLEIIVSDDCGQVDLDSAIGAFQDSRIRLRRNSQNLGISANAVCAVTESKGEYVASLNDDDLWHECFVETLLQPLEENPDLALTFCDYYAMNEAGDVDLALTEKTTRQQKRDCLKEGTYPNFGEIGLVSKSIFPSSAALIRKDAVEWDCLSDAGAFWDIYLVYLVFRSGLGAYYCAQRLAYYRIHVCSMTQSGLASKIYKAKSGVFCYQRFAEDDKLQAYRAYFKQEWAYASTNLGIGYLRSKKIVEARTCLTQALQQHKFNLRTLTALGVSYLPQPIAQLLALARNPNLFSRAR